MLSPRAWNTRHGDLHLGVRSRHPHHVHVEVVDQGDGFAPAARSRATSDPGGWGLQLVERLADRWGVRRESTRVWFEIDRAG